LTVSGSLRTIPDARKLHRLAIGVLQLPAVEGAAGAAPPSFRP